MHAVLESADLLGDPNVGGEEDELGEVCSLELRNQGAEETRSQPSSNLEGGAEDKGLEVVAPDEAVAAGPRAHRLVPGGQYGQDRGECPVLPRSLSLFLRTLLKGGTNTGPR